MEPELIHATDRGPSMAAFAFRVVADNGQERRRFVVVARDIVEAAEHAERALDVRQDGPWTILRIRLTCEALR